MPISARCSRSRVSSSASSTDSSTPRAESTSLRCRPIRLFSPAPAAAFSLPICSRATSAHRSPEPPSGIATGRADGGFKSCVARQSARRAILEAPFSVPRLSPHPKVARLRVRGECRADPAGESGRPRAAVVFSPHPPPEKPRKTRSKTSSATVTLPHSGLENESCICRGNGV